MSAPWKSPPETVAQDCSACDIPRREFIGDVLAAALAAMATLGYAGGAEATTFAIASPLTVNAATRTYAIPTEDGATIDKPNRIILVRWEGAIYAFALACPHENTALRWDAKRSRFQCPRHKSRYTPDGTFVSGKATRGMDRFAVRRDGASVVVDTGTLYNEEENHSGWSSAKLNLG